MMNKGLEVIEAKWLFHLAPDQIQVLIHPQSIVHSMVVCRDQSVLAQLGTPDMRVPIAYALSYPDRVASGASRLDLRQTAALSFEDPDPRRFPALQLAWAALRGPEGSTAVLNAANEVAVEAFLARRLPFTGIAALVAEVLSRLSPSAADVCSVGDLMALDTRARAIARTVLPN
jgi:1-deoxy-D-xylulose-5-phosphate reductoisomerase